MRLAATGASMCPRFHVDRVELRLGSAATEIDRTAKTVRTGDGHCVTYDALVLATGSSPFVPPVRGNALLLGRFKPKG